MEDGLKTRHRKSIIAILSANPRVERAVLFGSRAMGTFTTTSDVDIALFGDELTLTDHAGIAAAIDRSPAGRSVVAQDHQEQEPAQGYRNAWGGLV